MLTRRMYVPADAERVWRALTDPDEVTRWFGATVEWHLEPGGGASWRDEGDGSERRGRVEEVGPGRMRFRWWPADRPEETSEVTYCVEPADDGSEVTISERRVTPDEPTASATTTGRASADTRLAPACRGGRTMLWTTADDRAWSALAATALVPVLA